MNNFLNFSCILFCLIYSNVNAQDFDHSVLTVIKSVTSEIEAATRDSLKLAIYPFKYKKKNEAILAEYVTEEFWDKVPKNLKNHSLVDRATFEVYFKEHELKSKGLIDPKTEKQFGMLIAADAYVTGKVYVFNSFIRIIVSATYTQTGDIITTATGKLPITYDIANSLGLETWQKKKKEAEKNKSTNPNCNETNVGDVCFQNNSREVYEIKIHDIGGTLSQIYRQITVRPGNYACFKDLPSGSYAYNVTVNKKYYTSVKKGNAFITTCGSSVINID